jgi:hypothetical protein
MPVVEIRHANQGYSQPFLPRFAKLVFDGTNIHNVEKSVVKQSPESRY